MTGVDRAEVERWLPHRAPFLLIDRAEAFVAGQSIVGVAELGADWPHFAGHFPGFPVMPGVLLIEAIAQTGALLTAKSENMDPAAGLLMLASVESARFRAPVRPGSTLKLHVEQRNARHGLYRYRGEAKVEDTRVGEVVFAAKLVRGMA